MPLENDLTEKESPKRKWWGEYQFELNHPRSWQFGSLLFRVTRGMQEWRMEYHRPTFQFDYEQQWHPIQDPEFGFPQPIKMERYMFRQTHDKIQIMPRLADRSVVIKPVDPIYIPADSAERYISAHRFGLLVLSKVLENLCLIYL